MPQCQIKGCENAAQWYRNYAGRMLNLCGSCRVLFANPNLPDPEVDDSGADTDNGDDKRVEKFRPVDNPVPELQGDDPGDDT